MAVKLQEMLKKAQKKGYTSNENVSPWQSNSTIKNPTPQNFNKNTTTGYTKTEDKLETNRGQTEDKLKTNRGQTEDKQETNQGQTKAKPSTQPRTKRGQTFDLATSYYTLTGLQRKIVLYIHDLCCITNNSITPPITIQTISSHCETTPFSAKKTIQRLIHNGTLTREKFKSGRGGWTIYSVSPELHNEIVRDKNFSISNPLATKNIYKPRTEHRTHESTSSSSNSTTTEISDKWTKIKVDKLSTFGFNKNHVFQISKLGTISPEELQQSIDFFVFDLEENNKAKEIKKSPVDFFMGILRRQGFYNAPKNYESLQKRALRMKIEHEKKELEEMQKMEKELIDIEFTKWSSNLSSDEKNKIMPEEVKQSRFDAEREGYLRTYFKDNFWEKIKKEKYADCF